MTVQERVKELAWLCDELQRETEILESGGNQVIHQFLAKSLLNGMTRRTAVLMNELGATGQVTSLEREKVS